MVRFGRLAAVFGDFSRAWFVAGLALSTAACGGGGAAPGVGLSNGSGGGGGSAFGASSSGGSSTFVPTVGFTTNVNEPAIAGKALFVYMPTGAGITDRSPDKGTEVTLYHSWTNNAGGASSTATLLSTTSLENGKLLYGTGNGKRDTINLATDSTQGYEYRPLPRYSYLTVVRSDGAGGVLNDASYGLATVATTSTGEIGMGGYHVGNVTDSGSLPGATATYVGKFTGYAGVAGSSATSSLSGDVTMTANFGTSKVTGDIRNLSTFGLDAYGISFDGTIKNSAYTGTAAFYSTLTGVATTSTSSAVNGAFYGANGAETAGAVRVEGPAPNMLGTSTAKYVVGAFGAKKQ